MKLLKTDDKVRYISDFHSKYTGQEITLIDFDLKHRLANAQCADGMIICVFWDEIEEVD